MILSANVSDVLVPIVLAPVCNTSVVGGVDDVIVLVGLELIPGWDGDDDDAGG